MAYNIGGMLSQSGQGIGQSIGMGLGNLGAGISSGISGLMTRRREKQAQQSAQQQFQQILEATSNRPADMLREAQLMMMSPDPNMQRAGKMLAEEANRIQGVRTAQAGALETAGQDMRREAQRKRAVQVATQANDQNALVALRAGALDPVEYLKSRATEKPEPTQFDYTEKTVMRDGKPVVVQFGISKTDPNVTIERVLGPAEQKEGGTADKKTLKELITEAGLDPQDYDITTLDGLKKLRSFVVTDVQNASLANTVSDMIKEMTPPGVQEAITVLRDIDPKFVSAEADLERVERFKALTALTDEDVSGLRNVIERVVSGTTESDIKAVQELQAFRGNKDIINKLKDFALGITSGRLSEETVQEYESIMEILGALANQRQMNTINNLIINGSPRETEAALKAKSFYSGSEQARIL